MIEAAFLRCHPDQGMSERLIISHYDNEFPGRAVETPKPHRGEARPELDYANAAGFLINGLKREQLVAMNSMVLHELFFDGLGGESEPGPELRDAFLK